MSVQPSQPQIVKRPDMFRRQLAELPAFRALLRAVEADFYQELPLPEPVLDLGCGDGHFATVAFSFQLDVGLDPWWGPLQEAQSRSAHRGLVRADGSLMPFPTAYFSTVVSNSVLEHIPNVDPVLREVSRVLAPGGWFHFAVPGPNFRRNLSVGRLLDRLGLSTLAERYRRAFDRISRHYYYWTPAEWENHLDQAGLHLETWWSYFSARALAALEWGHPLGLPCVVVKKLTGRWILAPFPWNLRLTEKLLRSLYGESLPTSGAYLFFSARKPLQPVIREDGDE